MDAFTQDVLADLSAADHLDLLEALTLDDSDGDSITQDDGLQKVPTTVVEVVRNEPIVKAAIRGDIPQLKELLRQPGVNVNIRDGIGDTALFAVVCHDKVDAAALLLEAKADPNIQSFDSWAALHAVSRSGNEDMAAILLDWKADTEIKDGADWTPLHVSSLYGTNIIADLLLERKANPNAQASDALTPLHTAVDFGNRDVIKTLIKHGAQLDATDNNGQTPLHIASMKRPFSPPVSLLLDLGADPKLADKKGYTALHFAVQAGHDPALAVIPLLQRGADPNIAAADGWTPLLWAVNQMVKPGDYGEVILKTLLGTSLTNLSISEASERAVQLLTYHGADTAIPVERDGHRITPVLQAAACHSPEEVEILRHLLTDASSKEKMAGDISLAHIAALHGHSNSLRLVLEYGAVATAADVEGETPLHLAARHSHPECISLLLAHGADVKAKANDRSTPLHEAASNADEDCVRLLLDAGADMLVRCDRGRMQSPIDIVREKLRLEEDDDLQKRYLWILTIMIERLAERDPRVGEVAQDRREGWSIEALQQLCVPDEEERPRGPTVAELRERYELKFSTEAGQH
ncbi:Pfs NACHT ankyrin domain-containing protein [Fusarium phyllophilum]|uniref:Pfs NACHT ankyrin domain-containing protein n=1 Tax=Fusarium phyllophilum TaxID=47803 RepID=A0A8H5J0D7_9HYPO|nr:Pfs NACHT ankyrin domain-containing protein [Fusarium phyllophilum]